jgi:hypothetical protein
MGRREFTQQYPINTRTIDQRDIRAYESMTIATSPPFYSRYEKTAWHVEFVESGKGGMQRVRTRSGPDGKRARGHVKLKLARI